MKKDDTIFYDQQPSVVIAGSSLLSAWNPVCMGVVYGVIGKLKLHPGECMHSLVLHVFLVEYIYVTCNAGRHRDRQTYR